MWNKKKFKRQIKKIHKNLLLRHVLDNAYNSIKISCGYIANKFYAQIEKKFHLCNEHQNYFQKLNK